MPSAGPWPVTVVTDSSEEEPLSAMLQDPISDAAPAAMTEISLSSHAPIVSSQPSHGRGRGRRSRRIRQTAASTPPRYTSPPDDMYLPNTPPAVDSAAPAFAEHASVPQRSPSSPDAMPLSHPGRRTRRTPVSGRYASPPDDMYLPNTPPAEESFSAAPAPAPVSASVSMRQRDPSPVDDMFLSDSSEELPTSIIPPASTPMARTLSTPLPVDSTRRRLNRQAVASTSNIDSSPNMSAQHTYPFNPPRPPQRVPLPSPFAHLTPSEFDKFIMDTLPKRLPK